MSYTVTLKSSGKTFLAKAKPNYSRSSCQMLESQSLMAVEMVCVAHAKEN